MFYFLHNLESFFGPARLFEYITFRAGCSGLTAFLIVVLLGGFTAKTLRKYRAQAENRYAGLLDNDKIDLAKEKTPSMGGILIISAVIIASLLWSNLTNAIPIVLIISTIECALIGFYDDYTKSFKKNPKGISGVLKFSLLTLVAISVVLVLLLLPATKEVMQGIIVPFRRTPWNIGYIFTIPLAILAIVGCSNAVNLTDGKDGLVSGCMIFTTIAISISAYFMGHKLWADYLNLPMISGAGESLIFGSAIIGACIGFLWHNCNPASMFMGDTGSLALGGALGVIAVILRQEIFLVVAGGVFVIEASSVMIQVPLRKYFNKRLFRCTPLHHHFEKNWGGSWTENQVVVRFWIIAGLLAFIALSTLKLR